MDASRGKPGPVSTTVPRPSSSVLNHEPQKVQVRLKKYGFWCGIFLFSDLYPSERDRIEHSSYPHPLVSWSVE